LLVVNTVNFFVRKYCYWLLLRWRGQGDNEIWNWSESETKKTHTLQQPHCASSFYFRYVVLVIYLLISLFSNMGNCDLTAKPCTLFLKRSW